MATPKKSGIVQRWRLFLRELEQEQGRRLKGTSRQSRVEIVIIRQSGIEAKVKWLTGGLGRNGFALKIPVVAWWASYHRQVATWLARRPDWQADFLNRQWNEEFLEFVASAGLQLFPEADYLEKMQKEAICSCSSPNKPCIHMIAVLESMLQQMETDPGRTLEFVGLPLSGLMDEAHTLTAEWLQAVNWNDVNEDSVTESDEIQDDVTVVEQNVTTIEGKRTLSVWRQETELVQRLCGQSTAGVVQQRNVRFATGISSEKMKQWAGKFC